MEMYLIRHTSPAVEKGICYGQTDLDVAESFSEEAQQVLRNLHDRNGLVVYSSPLQRCSKLAKLLSDGVFTSDARLMEMDFGDWEMQKWDDIDFDAVDKWSKDFVHECVPGGESYLLLHERVGDFLADLKSSKQKRVAIVSHAGTMRSILSHYGYTTLEESFETKLSYGDVVKLSETALEKIRI